MVKGGQRYSSRSNDGKWFAHQALHERETRSRETCTTTGIMLSQVKTPQALNSERYPKRHTRQTSSEYPFSCHDNKYSFKDSMDVFSNGVGRRKCPDYRSEHNSQLSLCQDEASNGNGGTSVYQKDFKEKAAANVDHRTRRFSRNHKLRSEEAALETKEQFMWFGRGSSDVKETSEVSTVPSKPLKYPYV
ncbi:testis-expressed protein 36 [Cololabis saira]|uniref:testis-expressed protein 36 n=1 Tax=Cololabis saira TaxID=129043 RepID=UPI002AD4C71D|nr:testis-expressed protein 36 [Cololabis saira]